jgi:hypothetical protein
MSETDRFEYVLRVTDQVCTELAPCLEADQIRNNNKAVPCVGRQIPYCGMSPERMLTRIYRVETTGWKTEHLNTLLHLQGARKITL